MMTFDAALSLMDIDGMASTALLFLGIDMKGQPFMSTPRKSSAVEAMPLISIKDNAAPKVTIHTHTRQAITHAALQIRLKIHVAMATYISTSKMVHVVGMLSSDILTMRCAVRGLKCTKTLGHTLYVAVRESLILDCILVVMVEKFISNIKGVVIIRCFPDMHKHVVAQRYTVLTVIKYVVITRFMILLCMDVAIKHRTQKVNMDVALGTFLTHPIRFVKMEKLVSEKGATPR